MHAEQPERERGRRPERDLGDECVKVGWTPPELMGANSNQVVKIGIEFRQFLAISDGSVAPFRQKVSQSWIKQHQHRPLPAR